MLVETIISSVYRQNKENHWFAIFDSLWCSYVVMHLHLQITLKLHLKFCTLSGAILGQNGRNYKIVQNLPHMLDYGIIIYNIQINNWS